MHRKSPIGGDGLQHVRDQLGTQAADRCSVKGQVDAGPRPSAEIDSHAGQSFVKRHGRVAKAPNASSFAERLVQRLSQADADVLSRMVLIHVQITLGPHGQIKPRVPGEAIKHVVQKADTCSNVSATRPVEVQYHLNPTLARLAANMGGSWSQRRLMHSSVGMVSPGVLETATTPTTVASQTRNWGKSALILLVTISMVLPLVAAEVWTGYRLAPSSLALTVISGLEQPLSVRSTVGPWAMALTIAWFALAYWRRTITLWEVALVLLGGAAILIRAGNAWVDALALAAPLTRQLLLLNPRRTLLAAVATLGLAATVYTLVSTRPPGLPAAAIQASVTSSTKGAVFADWRWASELQRRLGSERHVLAAGGLASESNEFWLDYDRIVQGHERWTEILDRMGASVLVLDSADQAHATADLVRESTTSWRVTYDADGVLVAERLR